MKYFRIVMGIALLLCTILILPTPTAACTCIEPLSAKKELNRTDAVFRGEVIDIKEKPDYLKAVQFTVNETWKGPNNREIQIHTARDSAACGFSFEVGKEYLVYAIINDYFGDDFLVTGICDRTSQLVMQQAQEDMKVLGQGLILTDSGEQPNDLSSVIIGLSIGLGALILITFLLVRKTKVR